jgi:hypothetical protein
MLRDKNKISAKNMYGSIDENINQASQLFFTDRLYNYKKSWIYEI